MAPSDKAVVVESKAATTVRRAPAQPGEDEPEFDDALCILDWCKYKNEFLGWKIRNLSLCRKILEHCHLVLNFLPVPEIVSKIQSDPFPLGYSVFQMVLENTQFEFM